METDRLDLEYLALKLEQAAEVTISHPEHAISPDLVRRAEGKLYRLQRLREIDAEAAAKGARSDATPPGDTGWGWGARFGPPRSEPAGFDEGVRAVAASKRPPDVDRHQGAMSP